MKTTGNLLLAAVLCFATLGLSAQTTTDRDSGAKQDIKDAAHSTARATKKTAHKVKRGTKKGVHKAANATKRGADKVEDKTEPNPR